LMIKFAPYQYLRDVRFIRAFFSLRYVGIRAALCVGLPAIAAVCPTARAQNINLVGVQVAIPASTLASPNGVAVDASGNVYIADTGYNRVLKETLSGGTYTQSVVDSTLSGPQSIAVDSIGDVYVADTANNRVLEETLSGGIYTQSTIPSSHLNNPVSIAIDATGDVYIVDQGNSRTIEEIFSAG